MRDSEIVALYFQRSEDALNETDRRYGKYLTKVAFNILADTEDSREAVIDALLAAWNSIPPHRPEKLLPYLSKLTRRTAIDMLRKRSRGKRKASEFALSLTELDDCIATDDTTVQQVDMQLLSQAINNYLRSIPQQSRDLFICRYFYADSIRDAAAYCGISEAKAKTMLYRLRQGLKKHLIKEGYLNE